MTRRILPTLLILAFGWIALVWGLASLQGVFAQEREDASLALEERRSALEAYAAKLLEEELAQGLRKRMPDITYAVKDPLLPADELFLRWKGEQLLPRRFEYLPGNETPARALYQSLRDPALATEIEESDSPWAERVRLLDQFMAAIQAGDREKLEASFREILRHRANYVVSATKDIPHAIALIDFFLAESSPDPSTLQMLLREGIGTERQHVEGLQRQLLLQRSQFSKPDFDFLSQRLLTLSEAAHVQRDDFLDRIAEAPGQVELSVHDVQFDSLIFSSGWYMRPDGGDVFRGYRIRPEDVELILDRITTQMKERGLLDQESRTVLVYPGYPVQPASEFEIKMSSPNWKTARSRIESRFRLKTVLNLVCGVFAFAIGALAVLALQQKQRFLQLKSDFIATVSHELKTPLASIRLQAETLEWRVADLEGARDYPARIIKDIDGLSFLVENILSFNRLEKGKWKLQKAELSLSELAANVQSGTVHPKRKLEVVVQNSERATFSADPELMTLLFLNLARNACDYNQNEPAILTLEAPAGQPQRILIRDNGIGIEQNAWKSVFEEFTRLPNASGARGTGIGLAICRKIMKAHGGTIRIVESSSAGTVFELEFR